MVRVWVGDMRGAQSRWCIADVGIQFFIHNLSMQISVRYCLTSRLPTNRLENSWNLGQGFFVVTDGGDWVTELHSLQVCLFIYQKHRAKIIITFMNYWKIHDVFKQRPQVKPFMRPCSMQHPAFNRSSRRPGVESSPCFFVSEELGKAEKFD